MTHPLLAFMATPMADPETRALRRMRHTWVLLCAALILAVALNPASVSLFGPWGALPALLLLMATPIVGMIYWRAKTRADAAWNRSDHPKGEA
ncbi:MULTISPECIES: hypothetical protein [Sphingomonadales]|jgi:hypothetical protein|uniref:Inner membrane protein n=2 Tax=Sphingomonadales TaxID=204457 RepID=A0A0G3XNL4_9SPHN|nr:MULTISPECIES: hypothetical protein [Sphingomonadales]AIT82705.1 inner membrane protein [Novosphingobium pentaromativorans US6-1]AKM12206.1 inner membrane protein [Croceicoccus naphthovorans]EHJ58093.1 hypothetical protein NSU_pLA1199 [Novosphingobium pentaromativorans US6-1]MBB3991041.1 Na+/pantothenate symporter [Croceicoccus naphthovorans]